MVLSLDLMESTQADSLKIWFVQLIFRVVRSGYTAYVYVYICMYAYFVMYVYMYVGIFFFPCDCVNLTVDTVMLVSASGGIY